MPENIISSHHFTASETGSDSGPHIVVFGGLHGNEICGMEAIRDLMTELRSGQLTLQSGCLTLVPVANPKAAEQGVRFIDHNLNRIFHHACLDQDSQGYEHTLLPELLTLAKKADILIDLHSMTDNAPPFALIAPEDDQHIILAEAANLNHIMVQSTAIIADHHFTTMDFGLYHDIESLSVECGQHDDPAAITVAYEVIRNICDHFNVIAYPEKRSPVKPAFYHVQSVVRREAPGRFVRDWQSFDFVERGMPLALYENGRAVQADTTGFIFMPNEATPLNEEWLTIIQQIEKPHYARPLSHHR